MASLATAAGVAGAVGAATSAVGAITQGQATGRAAAYQSQVSANNAIVANQNAQYSLEAGEAQASRQSMASRAQGGAIKADEGANNIDVNTGSAADVEESQREIGDLDTMTTLNNAMRQEYSYETQATGFTAESQLEEATAEEAPEEGFLSAAGGLLGSASSIGLKFFPPGNSGGPNSAGGGSGVS